LTQKAARLTDAQAAIATLQEGATARFAQISALTEQLAGVASSENQYRQAGHDIVNVTPILKSAVLTSRFSGGSGRKSSIPTSRGTQWRDHVG
jgi:multidrug resistance efflux pump